MEMTRRIGGRDKEGEGGGGTCLLCEELCAGLPIWGGIAAEGWP